MGKKKRNKRVEKQRNRFERWLNSAHDEMMNIFCEGRLVFSGMLDNPLRAMTPEIAEDVARTKVDYEVPASVLDKCFFALTNEECIVCEVERDEALSTRMAHHEFEAMKMATEGTYSLFDTRRTARPSFVHNRTFSYALAHCLIAVNTAMALNSKSDFSHVKSWSGSWSRDMTKFIDDELIVDIAGWDLVCVDDWSGDEFTGRAMLVFPVWSQFADVLFYMAVVFGDSPVWQVHRTLFVVDENGNLDEAASCAVINKLAMRRSLFPLGSKNVAHTFSSVEFDEVLARDAFASVALASEYLAEDSGAIVPAQEPEPVLSVEEARIHELTEELSRSRREMERFTDELKSLRDVVAGEDARVREAVDAAVAEYAHKLSLAESRIREFEALERDESSEVRALAHDAKVLRDENDSLRSRLAAVNAIRETVDEMKLPQTSLDALILAEDLWPDRLEVTEDAVKSADAFTKGEAFEVFEHLQALATTMWTLVFEEDSNNPQKDFEDRCHIECTLRTTGRVKINRLEDAWTVMYKGEKVPMYPHTKGRNRMVGRALRVHFFFDHDDKKIVIGHCGEHLETTLTPRLT